MKRKGVSGSPGLVDFANGLVNSVLKLREVFEGNSNYRRTVINSAYQKQFLMTLGLVHSS